MPFKVKHYDITPTTTSQAAALNFQLNLEKSVSKMVGGGGSGRVAAFSSKILDCP